MFRHTEEAWSMAVINMQSGAIRRMGSRICLLSAVTRVMVVFLLARADRQEATLTPRQTGNRGQGG